MHTPIDDYIAALPEPDRAVAARLAAAIQAGLPGAAGKLWHGHPVWFLDDNPVVGVSKRKVGVTLLFWSGRSFDEPTLQPEGRFQAAEARFTAPDQVDPVTLARWLEKAAAIQWDYKNLVKRKGQLLRLA
ncbi:DUF1801 domain-containing protein [Myxococcota bacterium]|nr:DUF1801 domain-containing protein [Myxococcota bacterium]